MIEQIHPLEKFIQALKNPTITTELSYEPIIFRLTTAEQATFHQFCQVFSITIIDHIDRQLEDLVRVQNPSITDKALRLQQVEALLKDTEKIAATTNWVYYPWLQQVVHILQQADYFSVITNRNQYKITAAEQITLKQKTIGVIGLSVGGEAAITVSQEHLCGKIKIADFDELDLSNLNRLNASVADIGVLKTTISARRIYLINPYLQVEVFPEGIHETNMHDFLNGLDLLIEECDGLEIKFPIRQVAKSLKINTIYAADERGLLSIEPYGYDPDFPIFHGILKEPQLPRTAFDNDAAFMKTLAIWCGGWDLISERSRAALTDMGNKICGYPQLASEARFAAGQLGHVARRLLLGEQLQPFFQHIDLEELVKVSRQ